MFRLRTNVFAILFFLHTAFWVIACLVVSPLGQKAVQRSVYRWVRGHYWLANHLLGVTTRVEGAIPPGAYLIAVKHQSMYETMEIARFCDTPIMVMKQELDRVPLFGLVTRLYGVIAVDREAGSKAVRYLVAEGQKAAREKRPIVIFPEGTRVPAGTAPPLRSGFYALYRSLGLPVVPVAMDSGRLFGKIIPTAPGVVTFRVGEVIPAGLSRKEAEARVYAGINALEPAARSAIESAAQARP